MIRSSMNSSIILVTRRSRIMISKNMIKNVSNNSVRTWVLDFRKTNSADGTKTLLWTECSTQRRRRWYAAHQTWTEDEPWWRSLSSRAGRFPKTLFALSRCRIPKAKGSGDLLSHLLVHADKRDGLGYAWFCNITLSWSILWWQPMG